MSALPSSSPSGDSGYPARPAGQHKRCLNGHDLALARVSHGWDHSVYVPITTCELCFALRLPRATWYEVNLQFVHEAPATAASLVLAARPPRVLGGVGQIVLLLHGQPVGDLDVQMCQVDRRGVIEQVRVDPSPSYRRRGFGTVLLAAALSRGRGFRWSTTAIEDSLAARAFWASQHLPDAMTLGDPRRCTHMLQANGKDF